MSVHFLHAETRGKAGLRSVPMQSFSELMAELEGHHSSQMALCEELEALADSLPEQFDSTRCLRAARALNPAVQHAHRFEEETLFPQLASALQNVQPAASALQDSLRRLRYEHLEDESYAEELAEKLIDYADNRADLNDGENAERSELLGYMLRGFFEGVRRHIAFEREHIIPLMQEVARHPM